MCTGIIYKIENKLNKKVYVGKTTKIDNFESYYGSGKIIKAALKKYGKESFTKEIIHYAFSMEELNEKEIYFIKHYNSAIPNGYNIGLGGEGNSLFYYDNNTIQVIKEKRKIGIHNYYKSDDYLIVGSKERSANNSGKNNPMYGKSGHTKPHTEKTKKTLSDINKGKSGHTKPHTEKTKKTLSDINKGKKLSNATKRKISISAKESMTEERKQMLRVFKSMQLICVTTGKVYNSQQEVLQAFKGIFGYKLLSKHLDKKITDIKGYVFEKI